MLSPDILKYFASFIESQTGIVYNDVTFFQLENRLNTIATQLGFSSVPAFYESVKPKGITGSAKELLIDLATNNETSFFRDPKMFDAFATNVLPNYLSTNNSSPIKIWCAASSTGQEIYSLAMLLAEFSEKIKPVSYQIFATDISERVLNRCRLGKYTQLEIQRGLHAQRLINFFSQVPDAGDGQIWEVNAALKKHITWTKANLKDPFNPAWGPFDFIFCRNVLIYQTVENKKIIIERMTKLLKPNGFLTLGGVESLVGLSSDYEQLSEKGAIFYRLSSPIATAKKAG